MRRIFVSVTNDLATDQRVRKTCDHLEKRGWQVTLIGRKLPGSLPVERSYATKRFRLWFNKGALFYANYNIRLFFFLMSRKYQALYSNDLDTLPANFMASRLKGRPLVYDSHEYFTEVPEIQEKPFVKWVWSSIERFIFPRLKHVITVNRSIADAYEKKYGREVAVLRNLPDSGSKPAFNKSRYDLGLPEDKKILIMQGAGINIDRGSEELVQAMKHLDNHLLLVIGGGDVFPILREMVKNEGLEDRVRLMDKMPRPELMEYTACSDLGVSLDKDTNLNYRFSLPNKLFDYLQAGVPVLVSKLPEVQRVVEDYKVGWVIRSHEPAQIAEMVKEAFADEEYYLHIRSNTRVAAKELSWENETGDLDEILVEIEREVDS